MLDDGLPCPHPPRILFIYYCTTTTYPVKHNDAGMDEMVTSLCAAALQYSAYFQARSPYTCGWSWPKLIVITYQWTTWALTRRVGEFAVRTRDLILKTSDLISLGCSIIFSGADSTSIISNLIKTREKKKNQWNWFSIKRFEVEVLDQRERIKNQLVLKEISKEKCYLFDIETKTNNGNWIGGTARAMENDKNIKTRQ